MVRRAWLPYCVFVFSSYEMFDASNGDASRKQTVIREKSKKKKQTRSAKFHLETIIHGQRTRPGEGTKARRRGVARRLRKLLYNGFERVLVFARHPGGSMQITRWFRSLHFKSPWQRKPQAISVRLFSVTSFAKETRSAALLLFPTGRHSLSIKDSARPRK